MRRGAGGHRRDANERAIVDALRKVGAEVWYVSGCGLPDLLVRHRGRYLVAEVKTATGALTEYQGAFPVWRTVEDALHALGVQG